MIKIAIFDQPRDDTRRGRVVQVNKLLNYFRNNFVNSVHACPDLKSDRKTKITIALN